MPLDADEFGSLGVELCILFLFSFKVLYVGELDDYNNAIIDSVCDSNFASCFPYLEKRFSQFQVRFIHAYICC